MCVKMSWNGESMKTELYETAFTEVLCFIESARQRANVAVNTNLIDLYWQIGEYISHRIDENGWGKGTVTALAAFIGGIIRVNGDFPPRISGG